MATLLVVRFAGTGMREYHDLGLCIAATDDDTVRVIYADREVICKAYEIQKALYNVDVQLLNNSSAECVCVTQTDGHLGPGTAPIMIPP